MLDGLVADGADVVGDVVVSACGYPGCTYEGEHRPYRGKRDMPSVTAVTGLVDDDKSRSFAWSAALIAASQAVHHGDNWSGLAGQMSDRAIRAGHTECIEQKEGLCKACEFLRSEHDRRWKAKAALGSHVHHMALSWAQGDDVDVDTVCSPYMDALEKFYRDCDPEFHVLESTVLYDTSRSHAYRGQLDFVATLTRGVQRRKGLWDIKTGSYWPVEQTLQLSGYRFAKHLTDWSTGEEVKCGPVPQVAEAGVLLLGADGEYRLVELPADGDAHAVFLRQVDLWHWCKRMRRWEKDHPSGIEPNDEKETAA